MGKGKTLFYFSAKGCKQNRVFPVILTCEKEETKRDNTMRTMFNVISDKKRVHRRFFTIKKVVKEPVDNYGYGGAWKQPFRDDEGEFMGCLSFGVLKKVEI